ncbi:MAG: DUF7035 domain-containing protein [Luteolibacter sp.]
MNDNMGSATILATGLPANFSANNDLATMETGEPTFGGSAVSSVWYQWTAPGTSRVSISSVGSAGFQPVIGLFTGNQVAALQEVGRNNGSIIVSGRPAPLVFMAQGGTTYRIRISGAGTIPTGTFDFEMQPFDEPAVRFTALSLSPSAVDVGAVAKNVTVQINVESDQSLFNNRFIEVVLAPQAAGVSGPFVRFQLTQADRISGTEFSGIYSRTIPIPAFCPAATWIPQLRVFSPSGFWNWTPAGEDPISDYLLLPVTGVVLNVQNTGLIDQTPPAVASVTGLPASADVSNLPVPVTLTIAVTDDLVGFSLGTVSLVESSPGGSQAVTQLSAFSPALRVSGDEMNGVYEVQFELDSSLPNGIYELNVWLKDSLGRSVNFGPFGTPLPGGSTKTIKIGPALAAYAAWAALQDFGPLGLSGMQDDPNQDGTSNLLCYAFNIPPYTGVARAMTAENGDLSGLPAISTIGTDDQRRIRIEYLRRLSPNNGVVYIGEFGSNLQDSGPTRWVIHTGDEVTTPINSEWQRVVIEDSTRGLPARFGRLFVLGDP